MNFNVEFGAAVWFLILTSVHLVQTGDIFRCDFDNGDDPWCQLRPESFENLKLERKSSSQDNGYYLSAKSKGNTPVTATAKLHFPDLLGETSCATLKYSTHVTSGIWSILLFRQSNGTGSPNNDANKQEFVSGSAAVNLAATSQVKLQNWLGMRFQIPKTAVKTHFYLTVTSFVGELGIDDISVRQGDCSADPFPVRLVGSNSTNEGRVEVYYNNVWGTVCSRGWDDQDARVICRMLGYKGDAFAIKDGRFDSGSGPIWLERVICLSEHTELSQCCFSGWGENSCSHSEDAGVLCENIKGGPLTTSLPTPEMPQSRSVYFCDFEKSVADCGYNNNFNWIRHRGSTPTSSTGPAYDHTFGNSTGHYIYMKSSDGNSKYKAVVYSPPLNPDIRYEVRFFYHMYGRNMGSLGVYSADSRKFLTQRLWFRNGYSDNRWQEAVVTVPARTTYIYFEGQVRGSLTYSDIALDDIHILCQLCSHVMPNVPSGCPKDYFRCNNGKCILPMWLCDQNNDCGDYSDENAAQCQSSTRYVTTPSLTTAYSSCGGTLTGDSGNFTSPGYPFYYQSNQHCIWNIIVRHGFIIRLSFDSFNLEYHSTCAYDYLSVFDNTTIGTGGLVYKRYCGTNLPPPVTSVENMMTVVFHSDNGNQRSGFRANYVTLRHNVSKGATCGRNVLLQDGFGVISSPNYPQNYPNDKHCEWTIEVEPDYNVRLVFQSFRLELGSKCQFDYVAVYDNSTNMNQDSSLGRYCGTSIPSMVTSDGSTLFVIFHSDSSDTYSGFRAMYYAVNTSDNSTKLNITEETTPSEFKNVTTERPTAGVTTESGSCGGTLTGSSGTFASPGYPNYYPNNVNCSWDITGGPGLQIWLIFHSFDLETGGSNCTFDYVIISDSNRTSGKHCGSNKPPLFHSVKDRVTVRFRTDGSAVRRGFSATYYVSQNQTLFTTPMTTTSPGPTTIPPIMPALPEGIDVMQCSFENSSCNFNLNADGWDLYEGKNASQYQGIPDKDHTTASEMGHYLLAFAEDQTSSNSSVKSTVTDVNSLGYQPHCLHFWYQINGQGMNLSISAQAGRYSKILLWSRHGNHGKTWFLGQVTVPRVAGNSLQLMLEHSVLSNANGYTAVDDIKLTTGDCRLNIADCGNPSVHPKRVKRIVEGSDAIPHSWPWMVKLYYRGRFLCGGVLIAHSWVLSAAHCFYGRSTSPADYVFALGDHTPNITEHSQQNVRMKKVIIHENYRGNTPSTPNDIALVKLDKYMPVLSEIHPVCLPERMTVFPPGKQCYATGWGRNHTVFIDCSTIGYYGCSGLSQKSDSSNTLWNPVIRSGYILFSASDGVTGAVTKYTTNSIPAYGFAGKFCIELGYLHSGSDVGTVKIYSSGNQIWKNSADRGVDFTKVRLEIDEPSVTEIVLEVKKGKGRIGFIAVRSVVAWTGHCKAGPEPVVKLRQVKLPIISNAQCRSAWQNVLGVTVVSSHLCVGVGHNSKSACSGDSGGPLVCETSDNRWLLAGITSWGSAICSIMKYPSVFTRVTSYTDWIKEKIEVEDAPPTSPPPPTTMVPRSEVFCNFETSITACGFSIKRSGAYNHDWRRHRGPTPSSPTGPSHDHTFGNSSGNSSGYYIYVEATGHSGERALLSSPRLQTDTAYQLIFWYHMYGNRMGSLTVHAGNSSVSKTSIWNRAGISVNRWQQAVVDVPQRSAFIYFEGLVGSAYTSDIALDDIYICANCSLNATVTDPTYTTSTEAVTTTTGIPNSCGGTLTGSSGTFASPGYPNNYPNNANCYWYITGGPGLKIWLIFHSFDLESYFSCPYDYVIISDSNRSSGKYCGRNKPPLFHSVRDRVTVQFRTDGSVVGRGFSATYYVSQNQTRSFPGYSQCSNGDYINSTLLCDGRSDCSDGSDERLEDCYDVFTHCNFDNSTCNFHQVSCTDDFDWTSGRFGTPTFGTGPGGDHTSGSGSYMFIETSSPRRRNERAHFQSVTFPEGAYDKKMTFWYHMYGSHVGQLNVYGVTNYYVASRVFNISGGSSNRWLYSGIINLYSAKYIVIEGVVGPGEYGDIAIDDVTLYSNNRSSGTTIPRGTTTTLTPSHSTWTATTSTTTQTIPTTTTQTVPTTTTQTVPDPTTQTVPTTTTQTTPTTTTTQTTPTTTIPYIFGAIFDPCSFDSDFCGFNQLTSDDFDWSRKTGRTPSRGTGPSQDHPSGKGSYIYIEASLPRVKNDKAVLISKKLPYGHSKSVSFSYHMHGNDIGSLKISELTAGTETLVWEISGDQGNKWISSPKIKLSNNAENIKVEGTREDGYQGDIAMDNFIFSCPHCAVNQPGISYPTTLSGVSTQPLVTTQPNAFSQLTSTATTSSTISESSTVTSTTSVTTSRAPSSLLNCNFESTCGFKQRPGEVMKWIVWRGGTPSLRTGPSNDHTYPMKFHGHYVYIEATGVENYATATLEYIFSNASSVPYCVRFWYHMFGHHIGALIVLAKNGQYTSIWSKTGNEQVNQNDTSWHEGNVELPVASSSLAFFGVRGLGYQGDIALDDITVSLGDCAIKY